jgi:tetratricopeptide (TPR) repeat protein
MAHARLAEAWLELDYWDKSKDELLLANTLVQNKSALPLTDSLYLEAVAASLRRDQDTAVDLYGKIVAQVDDSAQKARAYLELGHAQIKNEDIAKAMESYSEAARLDPNCAAAYWRLGNLYGRQQDLQKAGANLDKAEEIYRATDNFEGLAEVYYQRGTLASSVDRVGEAQQLLAHGFELTKTTKEQAPANQDSPATVRRRLHSGQHHSGYSIRDRSYRPGAGR